MHERQRFAVALAGVGGGFAIAALIVISGPHGIATPAVHGVPGARAEPLPHLPMPSWPDAPPALEGPATQVRPREPVARRAEALATAPAQRHLPSSLVHRQFTTPLVLGHAVDAAGPDVVVAAPRARERGAVTGAFVTAGTHVGEGFKTVGRTLKKVF